MADKGDEEITIDFSKVKNAFKGLKSKEPKSSTEHKVEKEPSPDDEISLDLSKITGFFKKSKKESSEDKRADDEVSFDVGDLKSVLVFLNKYKIVFLIMIAIFLATYFRMFPAELPVTDNWARDNVHNYYRNQILGQVNQQYPHLPDENKNSIVNEEFSKLLKEQGDMIDQQIQATSQQFKSEFQDENGQTYLLAIDPYFWLRFVENLEKNGHVGDELIDGKPFDNHFEAPIGRFIGKDTFHIYFEYYLYKFLSIFNRDMYPMKAAFLAPVIISALSVIPAFFIGRRIAGDVGGFFASVMVAIHPAFITRTVGGFSDTDPYNVFFPLLIAWVFLEAFETKKPKLTIILSVVAGLIVGIYSKTWSGWWYIVDFLLISWGLYFIYYVIINRKTLGSKRTRNVLINILLLAIVFVVGSAVFVTLFMSFGDFTRMYTAPTFFISLKEVAGESIEPNVYTTVAEQNAIPLAGVISQIGGIGMFALACIGIILTMLKRDKHGRIDVKYALLLSIWFVSTIFASVRGVRFILLLVPAYSIAIGVFAGAVTKYAGEFISKELKINKQIASGVIIIVLALLFIAPFNQAKSTAMQEIPSMNDAWVRSLTLIKTNSSENAIINSWWDFGHWFKYWADRPVTFDGTSQTGFRAHFIGRVLLTNDEDEAIGILKFLDCGGKEGFNIMDSEIEDSLTSMMLLKDIIMLDSDDAKNVLLDYVDSSIAEEVLELTHCEPPEDFFITSEDMVGKSGVWAHFGSWNFTKADMVWRVKPKKVDEGIQILQDRYGLSVEEADKFYYEIQTQDANNWIAPWPSFASGLSGCTSDGEIVSCGNGILFNLTSEDAYVDTPQGRLHPKSFSFIKNGVFSEISYEEDIITSNNGQALGAALIPDGDRYVSILMSPELTGSMFTRMFYYRDETLKHFKPFHFDRTVTGLDILVWKVDWEGS